MPAHSTRPRVTWMLLGLLAAGVAACNQTSNPGGTKPADGELTVPVPLKVTKVRSAVLNPLKKTVKLIVETDQGVKEVLQPFQTEGTSDEEAAAALKEVKRVVVTDSEGREFTVPVELDASAPPV